MSNNNNDNSDNRLCNKTTIRRITFYFGGRGGVKRKNVKISRKGSNAHAHFVFRLLEYCVHSSALKRNLGIVSNVRRVLVALVGFSTTFFYHHTRIWLNFVDNCSWQKQSISTWIKPKGKYSVNIHWFHHSVKESNWTKEEKIWNKMRQQTKKKKSKNKRKMYG